METLNNYGISPDSSTHQLKQLLLLVSPAVHKGNPIPFESNGLWHVPEWIGITVPPLHTESQAVKRMLVMVLHFGLLSVDTIKSYQCGGAYNISESKDYLVGIDPSITTCGIAIWGVHDRRLLWLDTTDICGCIRFLQSIPVMERSRWGFVLEDPNCQQTTFAIHGGEKMTNARAASLGQDAGRVMAAAQGIEQTIKWLRLDYTRVNPSNRTCVRTIVSNKTVYLKPNAAHYLPTKTDATYFEAVTGWTGRSNEHERDAATLVAGREWAVIKTRAVIDALPKIFTKKRR